MALTNDQITAKNFKEFYEAILPYIGGTTEMLANKISKSDIYSETEKIVGQWTDGRPIYEKTIHFGGLENNKAVAHEIVNFDRCIDISGCLKATSGNSLNINTVVSSTFASNLSFTVNATDVTLTTSNTGLTSADTYIVLKYVKTGDTAIAVGTDTDYSTTEKIIGTWIDGKPLYQKTIDETVSTYTDNNNRRTFEYQYDSSCIVKNAFGYVQELNGSNNSYIMGSCLADGAMTAIPITTSISLSDKKFFLYRNKTSNTTSVKFAVTIQYTKTTD